MPLQLRTEPACNAISWQCTDRRTAESLLNASA